MTYLQEIKQLIKNGENQTTEFKSTFQKEVIESVVAFANHKGGKVFVGVNDSGKVVGVELNSETTQNWINQIKQNTSPSIIPNIDIVEIEMKSVAIIEVKQYPIKPVSCKNRYLIRRNNSNHLMSMEEIADEYLKTKNSSWDFYIDTTQNFKDISLEKVEKFIKKIEKNFSKSFDDTPIQILQKYGLIKEDKITFGAYLLFVKDFCPISGVQAGRFKTPTDIIDSVSLNSDLLDEVDELLIFIRKHLMVEYIITGNPQREERYDYPLEAIREIVLNMIVHRDYRDSSDSVIKIFDDYIEFFNPGDLYDGLKVEDLLSNNYESKTRNKLITSMFKECGLIEKYGSGISRIKKLCNEYGIVEPKFEEIQKGFRVTLYKEKINGGVNGGVSGGVSGGVNELLEFIKTNPNLRANEISASIKIPLRTVQRWLKQLRDEAKIEFKGSPKTGGYVVI